MLADEDLFRYTLAFTQLLGLGVLIYYAVVAWRCLRGMRDDEPRPNRKWTLAQWLLRHGLIR